jgi:hypothetical protein
MIGENESDFATENSQGEQIKGTAKSPPDLSRGL